MGDTRISTYIREQPWAILPGTLEALLEAGHREGQGHGLPAAEIQARLGPVERPPAPRGQAVAVLPLVGVIAHRQNRLTALTGGTSTETVTAQFRQALADPEVRAIVLDVDSPGGVVEGMEELATEILRSRGEKPIVAVANSLMASAAYWIASAAGEVVATPSGKVGSIGVVAIHTDVSKLEEQSGVTTTLISAGTYKEDGYGPLTDAARAHLQGLVDERYAAFVASVARGRGVVVEAVRSGFGEGRVVHAREALALGLIDRIATLDETLARLVGQRAGAGTAPAGRAEAFGEPLSSGSPEPLVAAEDATPDDTPAPSETPDADDQEPSANADRDLRERRLRVHAHRA